MPILIAVIAILLVFTFALGGDWSAADESTLYVLIGVVVALFLVLFFLPYLREFSRSEASRARVRKFRKKGKIWALRSIAASLVLAVVSVWWLRDELPTASVSSTPVNAVAKKEPVVVRAPAPMVSASIVPPTLQSPGKKVPASAPAPVAAAVDAGFATFISDWAHAWSDGDVEKYLAAYSSTFVPADGITRKAWEAQRRLRVDKGRGIVVKVRDLHVENTDATHAKVVFVQQYSARGVTDLSNKTLQLERQDGMWRITRETAVTIPKTE